MNAEVCTVCQQSDPRRTLRAAASMSHLTASEDIDLFTAVLDKACADASATAAFEADFLEALDAMDITCLSKFCAYKYGVFLVVPGGVGPLHEFRDELIAASAGKLTDDAMLGRTLFLLKDGCTQFWAEAKAKHRLPAGPPPAVVVAPAVMTDEEKERKDCATAYSDLETVQGRAVDLPMRAHVNLSAASSGSMTRTWSAFPGTLIQPTSREL